MKRLFLVFLLFSLSFSMYSQDRIIKHSADTIYCSVVELTESSAKFKYPEEDLINSISLIDVEKIVLRSGREIQGLQRVVIRGIEDQDKVIVAISPDEVSSYIKVTNWKATSRSAALGSYASLESLKEEAMRNLKFQAAKRQCHIIYITSDDSKKGIKGTSNWPEAILNANFYRYSDIQPVSMEDRFYELISSG